MATDRIILQDVLSSEEYERIDTFCRHYHSIESLGAVSRLLAEHFGVQMVADADIVAGFLTDSSNLPGRAEAVARPGSKRECAVITRACFAAGIPFTISAGRSSLTGSAAPDGGVILSTVNMLSPSTSVNRGAVAVRSPVGIVLEDLRKEVLKQTDGKFIFPVNPTSREDATVGGAIACNASGFAPGEIGSIRPWVKALDFLLPNGQEIRARRGEYVSECGRFVLVDRRGETQLPVPQYRRPAIKNASGPYSSPAGRLDFVDLVIGSEGIFGLVTECMLKIEKSPDNYLDLFFSLPGERNAIAFREYLTANLRDGMGGLTAFEYFGINCRKHIKHEGRLFRGDDKVGIYVQAPLTNLPVEDAAEEWLDILAESDCGINEDAVLLLDNARDRSVFFEARHSMPASAVEVVQRRGTFTIMTDTVVPPERFAEFLDYAHKVIRSAGIDYLSFGHLGDCHLHFTMLPNPGQLARASELYDDIVGKSAECGGVYSGEHGTGKRKIRDFVRCYGPEAAEQVRRSKAAVDPQFLLNRGNVIEYV